MTTQTIITHVGTSTLATLHAIPACGGFVRRLETTFATGDPPDTDVVRSVTDLIAERDRIWNRWSGTTAQDRRKRRQALPAELASLSLLNLHATDQVVLLHSQTPDGRFCARVLAGLLTREGATVQDFPTCAKERLKLVEVQGLRAASDHTSTTQITTAETFVREGLVYYVHEVWKIYHEANRGDKLVFNVTGGYKGMIPIARDVAMLLAAAHRSENPDFVCELCYLYEESSELIIYGSLPMTFTFERLLKDDLTKAALPHGTPAATSHLKEHPEWRPYFEAVPHQPQYHQRTALGEVMLALYAKLKPTW